MIKYEIGDTMETNTEEEFTSLPTDWELPDEWKDWLRNNIGINLQVAGKTLDEEFVNNFISLETERFKNYHVSENKKRSDWFSAWKNWCSMHRHLTLKDLGCQLNNIPIYKPITSNHNFTSWELNHSPYQEERNQELRLQSIKLASEIFMRLYDSDNYRTKEDVISSMTAILDMADIALEYIKGEL
jgi:hypothetical protein